MNKIIYAKCSNERDKQFSLKTIIYEDETGKKKVKKCPDTKEAEDHVYRIHQWYQQLEKQFSDTNIVMNRCNVVEDGVELEYLEKPSMESILDEMLLAGERENFVALVKKYLGQLLSVHQDKEFVITEGFRKVFGDVEVPDGEKCGVLTNIDALFANILVANEKTWCMLDYEWTFDFPIPVKYLIFRILFYYMHEHVARTCVSQWINMEEYGISEKDIVLYQEMERNFQKYIQGSRVPIRDMFDEISPGIIHLEDMKYLGKEALRKQSVQIYQSAQEVADEKDSYYQEIPKSNCFEMEIQIPTDIHYLRVDPCSQKCLVRNLKICEADSEWKYLTNGINLDESTLFFDTEDPWILMEEPEKIACKKMKVSFAIEFIDEKTVSIINNFLGEKEKNAVLKEREAELCQKIDENQKTIELKQLERDQLEAKVHQLEMLIERMENTKIWKMYSKYKSIGKKTGEK